MKKGFDRNASGENKMKKGFTISISTVLLVITIVWFSVFYAGFAQRQEAGIYSNYVIEKAGFVADDITEDVGSILGTGVGVNKSPNFTTIVFADKLPADINKLQLIDYAAFIDQNYAPRQNASIKLDFGRLVDGKTEMFFSNGLLYEHAYALEQNFVQFRKGDGSSTGVFTYDINVFVQSAKHDSEESEAWDCDNDGDVNVNLRYRDSYGERVDRFCKQHSDQEYEYEFAFEEITGNLVVKFGDVQGNENLVHVRSSIESENVFTSVSIGAELPSPSQELVWYYDADLNYMQGDVNLSRKIEPGRA